MVIGTNGGVMAVGGAAATVVCVLVGRDPPSLLLDGQTAITPAMAAMTPATTPTFCHPSRPPLISK